MAPRDLPQDSFVLDHEFQRVPLGQLQIRLPSGAQVRLLDLLLAPSAGLVPGTTAGTYAAGDDPRITGAYAASNPAGYVSLTALGTILASAVVANVSGTVAIAHGGTGGTTQGSALSNLGAAPLDSPQFTGNPQVPLAAQGDTSGSAANTSFVGRAIGANAKDFSVGLTVPGTPSASQRLLVYILPKVITFASGFPGTSAYALSGATATTVFPLTYIRSGATNAIGSFTFGPGSQSGTFSGTVPTLAAGDVLVLTAPSTPDATLADIGFSILGTKT